MPPLIDAVKKVPGDESWVLLDSPPGATCPVVTILQDADFALLVAEPTPFGRHDLALVLALARQLDIPCGVVINRSEGNDGPVERLCLREGIEILARMPFRREVAAACAEGALAVDADPEVAAAFSGLLSNLVAREVRT